MASRKRVKLSSYKRSSYLIFHQKISVNQDNSDEDTLTADAVSYRHIVLVNGDQHQSSSPVATNSEPESQTHY